MPRGIRDLALTALGIAVLVGVLALVDERVPGHVKGLAGDVSSGRWRAPGSPIGSILTDAAASRAADDAFLFALLATGVVLVILMVRT